MNKADILKAFNELNAKYRYALERLQEAQLLLSEQQNNKNDLAQAARLMASSELNKEDLSEQEILNMLNKTSQEELKRKIGFWAMPLPKKDDVQSNTDKRYIGKK